LPNLRTWARELDIEKRLDEAGGIVRIDNLFPLFVANATLSALRRVAPSAWELSDDVGDEGDIPHSFWSNDTADGIPEISRALWCLFPSKMPTFSAGL
jgi:hypothetical protein